LLGNVRDVLGKSNGFSHSTDFFVGRDEIAFGFRGTVFVLGTGEFPCTARVAIAGGDDGVQLRAVEEGVRNCTDSRGVITVLIVGEGSPF
jgi:hypothetical protein